MSRNEPKYEPVYTKKAGSLKISLFFAAANAALGGRFRAVQCIRSSAGAMGPPAAGETCMFDLVFAGLRRCQTGKHCSRYADRAFACTNPAREVFACRATDQRTYDNQVFRTVREHRRAICYSATKLFRRDFFQGHGSTHLSQREWSSGCPRQERQTCISGSVEASD